MIKPKSTDDLALSVIVAACIVALCVFIFWPILKTLVFAATVAVVLTPYYRWLERKLWGEKPRQWKQALTAGIVSIASIVILGLLVTVVVVVVVDNFELLRDFAVKVASVVQRWLDSLGAQVDLKKAVADRADALLGYVQGIFFAATAFAVRVVIFVGSLYFFLRRGGELLKNIRQSLGERHREVLARFTKPAHSVLYAIYVVHVATALLTFVLALPFFVLIGYTEHLIFWSLLCGIFQLVPLLGPSVIMFAIAAYAFATGDSTAGTLCLAVGYPFVAIVPDVVFRPIMMGRNVKLSALLLLLGFIGGIVSMGAIGFVLGPLVLTLLAVALGFASERMRAYYGAKEKAPAQ